MERLMEARHVYDITNIGFFNNGEVMKEPKYSSERMHEIDNKKQLKSIANVFYDAIKCYSRYYDFDNVDMNLLVGLLFDAKDIDENNQIKENAKPIRNTVLYYTSSVNCNLDGKKTNEVDYEKIGIGSQGYVNYNQFVSLIKESGLDFNGPESFEEFEENILMGEPFDIVLSANFKQKENTSTDNVVKTR